MRLPYECIQTIKAIGIRWLNLESYLFFKKQNRVNYLYLPPTRIEHGNKREN